MNILLDTHIWLWYLLGKSDLSQHHKRLIEDNSTHLWLSAISLWEAHLLIEHKRLPVDASPNTWIRKALSAFPVKEAQMTFSIALRSRKVKLKHQDPADRFITATAVEYELGLLTADSRIIECKEITCL